jgi:predicted acylesterase/phospholipase RssA
MPDPEIEPWGVLLPRSFFCMTTNLSRGTPSVHQEGVLWKLVRASMTIVGLVPPVYEQARLFWHPFS